MYDGGEQLEGLVYISLVIYFFSSVSDYLKLLLCVFISFWHFTLEKLNKLCLVIHKSTEF